MRYLQFTWSSASEVMLVQLGQVPLTYRVYWVWSTSTAMFARRYWELVVRSANIFLSISIFYILFQWVLEVFLIYEGTCIFFLITDLGYLLSSIADLVQALHTGNSQKLQFALLKYLLLISNYSYDYVLIPISLLYSDRYTGFREEF